MMRGEGELRSIFSATAEGNLDGEMCIRDSFYIVQHVIVDDYCKSESTPWLD